MELEEQPLVLEEDLTTIETTMPVMPEGFYDLRIDKISQEPNKDKSGMNGVLELTTTQPFTSESGKQVDPGHPLRVYFPLQNKADAKKGYDWRVRVAQIQEAALGEKKPRFDANELIGKIVRARVKIEDGDYGRRNNVGDLSQPK